MIDGQAGKPRDMNYRRLVGPDFGKEFVRDAGLL